MNQSIFLKTMLALVLVMGVIENTPASAQVNSVPNQNPNTTPSNPALPNAGQKADQALAQQIAIADPQQANFANGYVMQINRRVKRGSFETIDIPNHPFFDYMGRTYVGSFIIVTRGHGDLSVQADDSTIGAIGRKFVFRHSTKLTVNRFTAKLTFQHLGGPRVKIDKILFLPMSVSRGVYGTGMGVGTGVCAPSTGPICSPGPVIVDRPYVDQYCSSVIYAADPIHLSVNRLICLLDEGRRMMDYPRQSIFNDANILVVELQAMMIARSGMSEIQIKLAELVALLDGAEFQGRLNDLSQRPDQRAQMISRGIRYSLEQLKRSQ
jgi:hypothetical protein